MNDRFSREVRGEDSSLATGVTRRDFLRAASVSATSAATFGSAFGSGERLRAMKPVRRPKVAAIITQFTHRSHAHVILENFLEQYYFNGVLTDPGVDVVSIYADQLPGGDMSKKVSADYHIPMYKTISEALTRGGKELAVDAVLSIGEHGNYPHNELGQHMYPRKRFFDQIVAVMKRSNRFVPLFNDKHLSYRWDWAKEMVDTAKELGIPLMAGSSVPLAERRPQLEIPRGAELEEAVSIHGGGVESYDFHALEVLQSMVEGRKGGETGVSRVQFLDAAALFKAAQDGRWSLELAEAAMQAELGRKPTDLKSFHADPHGILLTYKDGFKATVVRIGGANRWNFACRFKGKPEIHATNFYVGPWQNRNLFKALSHAIQHHFIHGNVPYPVERTLLVTGVLDASMHSRHEAGKVRKTPELEFAYRPIDFRAMREMGASWKIITEDTPQPMGINPNGTKS
ncbi:MAG: hypothetical protein QGF59_12535 [Pirellulaceae bacterium]|jgi:hypothetical protein|nr:hypothetical protein [Pirellulaceae bacterium]MDP6719476.1 hypothetical protein [Pirellulaceae bacterium]